MVSVIINVSEYLCFNYVNVPRLQDYNIIEHLLNLSTDLGTTKKVIHNKKLCKLLESIYALVIFPTSPTVPQLIFLLCPHPNSKATLGFKEASVLILECFTLTWTTCVIRLRREVKS